jgi:hypothetical protein
MKIDSEQVDLPAFHRLHGKDRASGNHPVANLWQAAEYTKNKSADRRRILVGNFESESFVELADVRAA